MNDSVSFPMQFRVRLLSVCLIAAMFCAWPLSANAQLADFKLSASGKAVVIDQPAPNYPGHMVRRGQEGYVLMHFVVTRDGRAADPIIIDSSGGIGFEQEARKIIGKWRFEPPAGDAELPDNMISIRSEMRLGREAASPNFLRRYRRAVTHLHRDEYEDARIQLDDAQQLGGWNLYETTMLWLMIGRVEGGEGNDIGKLEAYQRALRIATRRAIGGKDRRDLLSRIFGMQDQIGNFAGAVRTYRQLEREAGGEEETEALAARAGEIAELVESAPTITAGATIYNPCDCDEGEPLWYYQPARRTFSFARVSGNVERFEARCETGRLGGRVEEDRTWTLPPGGNACHVFVFGDDGASFDFVEHLEGGPNENDSETAVARSHVLD